MRLYTTKEPIGSAVLVGPELALACKHQLLSKTPPFHLMDDCGTTTISVREQMSHNERDVVALWLDAPHGLNIFHIIEREVKETECLCIAGYPITTFAYTQLPAVCVRYPGLGFVNPQKELWYHIPNHHSTYDGVGMSGGVVVDSNGDLVSIHSKAAEYSSSRGKIFGSGVSAHVILEFLYTYCRYSQK